MVDCRTLGAKSATGITGRSRIRSRRAPVDSVILLTNNPLQFQVSIELPPGLRLGEDLETTLYRIIQESLNNVLKHAAATDVTLRLYQQPQAIA